MLDQFQAVTIDFHNTLMRCDTWFRLEVFDLVPAFLTWLDSNGNARVDGELHEQGRQFYRDLRHTVIETGIEIDAADCIKHTMEQLDIPVTSAEITSGLQAIMQPQIADASPMPGAVELVHALQARGIPMAVVSSAVYHPYLEWTLESHGMAGAFDRIISSASCGLYKSTPAIYEYAARALSSPPSACLHIGDSWRFDVDSASAAGFASALVGSDPQHEPGTEFPTLKADSLRQLHESLFGLTEMAS